MTYQRIGRKVIQHGTKRPEVLIFQQMCKDLNYNVGPIDGIAGGKVEETILEIQAEVQVKDDGKFGKSSWTLFLEKYSNIRITNPITLLQTITCGYETGAKDAYGFAQNDIGDNAGANYGVVQHNRLGSMATLLTLAKEYSLLENYNHTNKYIVNPDIKNWMGSSKGIEYQNIYFKKYIFNPAKRELDLLDFTFPQADLNFRLMGLFTDSLTQNGGMYSTYKKPVAVPGDYDAELYKGETWDYLFGEWCTFKQLDEKWEKYYKTYKLQYEKKEATQKTNIKVMKELVHTITEDQLKMEMIAQYRARTSSYRWWLVVLARRNSFARGKCVVQGSLIDLYQDYALSRIDPMW